MATNFAIPDSLEIAYRRAISSLMKSWLPEKLKDVSDSHWLRELAAKSNQKSVLLESSKVAFNMITRINVVNLKSWKDAAVQTQRSIVIHDLLQQELSGRMGVRVKSLVALNAKYLADIPSNVAAQLLNEIAEAQQKVIRHDAIAKILRFRFPSLIDSRIRLLARTATSSANTILTRARSEDLGISCFEWFTAQDGQRVRPSHRNMQGVVCFWGELPSPEALIGLKPSLGNYAAGDCPNCRCNSLPILHTESIFDRNHIVRVYHNGVIQKMTRKQFTNLSGIESRLAA